MAAPMDLNVPFISKDDTLQKIMMAAKLGYGVMAINNIQPGLLEKQKKQNKKQQQQEPIVQPPESLRLDEALVKSKIEGFGTVPKQLSRLSTVLKDASQQHILSNELVQSYDLIAVQPTDEKTFGQACKDLNIDIITIDVTERLPYRTKRPTVNAAIERGIVFEFIYSPAIRDDTMRRYFIANAQQIVFWSKGKNIILSSGCEKAFDLRGPHDVSNLGLLMDLKENQAKDAVTKNCRAALCHAESRRAWKSVLKVEQALSVSREEQSWILKKCSVEKENETKDEQIQEPLHKKAKLETTDS